MGQNTQTFVFLSPCLVYLQILGFVIPIHASKLIPLRCKTDFVCHVFP